MSLAGGYWQSARTGFVADFIVVMCQSKLALVRLEEERFLQLSRPGTQNRSKFSSSPTKQSKLAQSLAYWAEAG